MEVLLTDGYNDDAVIKAYDAFLTYYRQYIHETADDIYAPKTPENVLRALAQYITKYQGDDHKIVYLGDKPLIEIAGTVNLDENRIMHFRMDSILRNNKGIFSREHKTGSRSGRQWADQWSLSIQVGLYTHVLYCLYPVIDVRGVEINGTFFMKTKLDFLRVPCWKTPGQMQTWYHNVLHFLEMLEWQMSKLLDARDSDVVLYAFPLNTTNCTKYFGCAYHDFCTAWTNPLQYVDTIPEGMTIEYWDPSAEPAQCKLDLTTKKEG